MRKQFFVIFALALLCGVANAQNNPSPSPSPARTQPTPQASQTRPVAGFDLSDYGVRIQPEPRLIVVMAALDAAGFDPTPKGQDPSLFRAQVRKDQMELDADLRSRLRTFYERNKLPGGATHADQAARYISLAYALGAPPTLDAPTRTDDLPSGLLEVLDFAPLVREFYRKSGIEERLPTYIRIYQGEGDRLRPSAAEMIRAVVSYLHTKPLTVIEERVAVKSPSSANKKKDAPPTYTVRERQRRFHIVPDLLAAPGAINLRVIADDYYVVVPYDTNPASSELRRAYLHYVIDPLIIRFNRDIAARREQIKLLIDERAKAGSTVTTDVFSTVARSLVAAADARLTETTQLNALAREAQSRLRSVKDDAGRERIVKESQAAQAAVKDETVAQLADAYERGAVLAFYFADQLLGVETSGFDIANFFPDMIASFDPAREGRRLTESATARERANLARQSRRAQRSAAAETEVEPAANASSRTTLVRKLVEVNEMLRLKNYTEAEARLRALLLEFPGEPRIFFALGQAASLSAREATDEDVQSERLNRALAHYRLTVSASSADTDRALLSRAHEAMGLILEFLEQPTEAAKEFNAAIEIGRVEGGAYDDALAGKQRLAQPK
jgi:hypothetical protein